MTGREGGIYFEWTATQLGYAIDASKIWLDFHRNNARTYNSLIRKETFSEHVRQAQKELWSHHMNRCRHWKRKIEYLERQLVERKAEEGT